ncbi:MAG: hypothetical protein KDK35_04795 [Leptospiraceae bacterium]|nr:hypothetical protein [Leptospiraceae bacterium]MCP5485953.1 hypothetical protein [Spirochaetales bacterium]
MSWFRRLFRRKPKQTEFDPVAPPSQRMSELLRELRGRLERFLVTRSRPAGLLKETRDWKLSKTNEGLFRLDADGVSVLITTGSFLVRKDDRVQGLLRMTETALCWALSTDQKVDGFVAASEPPPQAASMQLYDELRGLAKDGARERLPSPEELLRWPPFDVDQMIARNSPNTLVHVLLHAGPQLENFLRGRLSRRLEAVLIEELESLNFPGSNPDLNPHSRRRSLLQFELALAEFRQCMQSYRREAEFRRRREAGKRLPVAGRS